MTGAHVGSTAVNRNAREKCNNDQHDDERRRSCTSHNDFAVAPSVWASGSRSSSPLLLSLLALLLALVGIATPTAGAACPAATYSDGYVYTKDNGGFTIANPGWSVSGTSFTTEAWLSSANKDTTRCWWGQVGSQAHTALHEHAE